MPEYRDPGKEAVRMEQLQRWLEEKRKKAKQAEQELDFAAMSTIKEEQEKRSSLSSRSLKKGSLTSTCSGCLVWLQR